MFDAQVCANAVKTLPDVSMPKQSNLAVQEVFCHLVNAGLPFFLADMYKVNFPFHEVLYIEWHAYYVCS